MTNTTNNARAQDPASPVCRMVRWCDGRIEAERTLELLLVDGWTGAMHDCIGLWQVDVQRPLRTRQDTHM